MNTSYYNENEGLQGRGRFSPLDYLTLIVGLVFTGLGVYLTATYKEGSTTLRDLTPIAKMGEIRSNPKRKVTGTLTFNPAQPKEVLFKGDQILTDEDDKAEVVFLDKTFLDIPPNSLIKLGFDNGKFDIELVKGFIDINLSQGVDTVTVRKGEKTYKLESQKGKVQIITGKGDLQFKAIEGNINVRDSQSKAAPKQIKPVVSNFKIIKPSSREQFDPNTQDSLSIRVGMASSAANGKPLPEVAISKSPTFEKTKIIKLKPEDLGKDQKIKLPKPGFYYIGIKEQGETTYRVTPFEVIPLVPPIIMNPNKGKTLEFYKGEKLPLSWTGKQDKYVVEIKSGKQVKRFKTSNNKIFLPVVASGKISYRVKVNKKSAPWSNWSSQEIKVKSGLTVDKKTTPDVLFKERLKEPLTLAVTSDKAAEKGFLFEVSKEKTFKEPIFRKNMKDTKFNWKGPAPGIYYWRASSLNNKAKSTGVQKVVVKAPAIRVSNTYKGEFESAQKKPKVRLQWREEIKETPYKLVVKDSLDKIIVEKEVKGNQTDVELPNLGAYKWSIAPIKNNEILTPTKPLPMLVTLPKKLVEPEIKPEQIIYYKDFNGSAAYQIELPKTKHAKSYYLEVYKDKAMKRLVFKKTFPQAMGYWISNRSGKYYYRVKVTDKWNRESSFSKLGTLIFPISPLVK